MLGVSGVNTLGGYRNGEKISGDRGSQGRGKNQHGRAGKERELAVPLGTVIWRRENGEKEWLGEIKREGERVLIGRGGRGGRGNARFKTSINQTPVLAEEGEPGEGSTLLLELRLIADVGIVGLPNAGKSTLLSVISRALPKVADYPFTTTEPILGVVERGWRAFVVVEIPGLLEGAHRGIGLGLEFLRHARRTRLLVHLVDGSVEDPVASMNAVNRELRLYDESLGERPQIVVVNKVDITEVRQRVADLRRELGPSGVALHFISAVTGEGVETLLVEVQKLLDKLPLEQPRGPEEIPVLRPKAKGARVSVTKEEGVYVVSSAGAERLVGLADLRQFQAKLQLRQEMIRLGVAKALEDAGVEPGDTVRIGATVFRWE